MLNGSSCFLKRIGFYYVGLDNYQWQGCRHLNFCWFGSCFCQNDLQAMVIFFQLRRSSKSVDCQAASSHLRPQLKDFNNLTTQPDEARRLGLSLGHVFYRSINQRSRLCLLLIYLILDQTSHVFYQFHENWIQQFSKHGQLFVSCYSINFSRCCFCLRYSVLACENSNQRVQLQ